MKLTVQPWRDPAFFGFVLLGLAFLCSSLLCFAQAQTAVRVAVHARPARPAAFVSSSKYAPQGEPARATPAPSGFGQPETGSF